MGSKTSIDWLFKGLLLTVISLVFAYGAGAEEQSDIAFQWYPVEEILAASLNVVGNAVHFQKWPRTDVRRVAPVVDKTLLSCPDLVTREAAVFHVVQFKEFPAGQGSWVWERVVETNEPPAAELPAEAKAYLLEKLPQNKRNDPNFVEEYLKRKQARYSKFKGRHLEGRINVTLCVAPSSRAGQELMLAVMAASNMPATAVASTYRRGKGPEGLGDVSFMTGSVSKGDICVKFVRDNIFVDIRSKGCFGEEGLGVAKKVDAVMVKQMPLTHQQLLARRPSIVVRPVVEKTASAKQKTVSYDVSAPAGQEIVRVKAYVDGENTWTRGNKIYIVGKKQKVKVKVTAITRELVCRTVEREVIIPQ